MPPHLPTSTYQTTLVLHLPTLVSLVLTHLRLLAQVHSAKPVTCTWLLLLQIWLSVHMPPSLYVLWSTVAQLMRQLLTPLVMWGLVLHPLINLTLLVLEELQVMLTSNTILEFSMLRQVLVCIKTILLDIHEYPHTTLLALHTVKA